MEQAEFVDVALVTAVVVDESDGFEDADPVPDALVVFVADLLAVEVELEEVEELDVFEDMDEVDEVDDRVGTGKVADDTAEEVREVDDVAEGDELLDEVLLGTEVTVKPS